MLKTHLLNSPDLFKNNNLNNKTQKYIVESYYKKFNKYKLVLLLSGLFLICFSLSSFGIILFVQNITKIDIDVSKIQINKIKSHRIFENQNNNQQNFHNIDNQKDSHQFILLTDGITNGLIKTNFKTYNFNTKFKSLPIEIRKSLINLGVESANLNINIQNNINRNIQNIYSEFGILNLQLTNSKVFVDNGIYLKIINNNSQISIYSDKMDIDNRDLYLKSQMPFGVKMTVETENSKVNITSNSIVSDLDGNQIISNNPSQIFSINNKNQKQFIDGFFQNGIQINKFEKIHKTPTNIEDVKKDNLENLIEKIFTINTIQKSKGYVFEGKNGNINIKNIDKNKKESQAKLKSEKIIAIFFQTTQDIIGYAMDNVILKYQAIENDFISTSDFVEYSNFKNNNDIYFDLKSNVVINIKKQNVDQNNLKNDEIKIVCGNVRYDLINNYAIFSDSVYLSGLSGKESFYVDGLKYNLEKGILAIFDKNDLIEFNNDYFAKTNIQTNYILSNNKTINIYENYIKSNNNLYQIFDRYHKKNNLTDNTNNEKSLFLKNNIAIENSINNNIDIKNLNDTTIQIKDDNQSKNLLLENSDTKESKQKIRININD